MRLPSHVLATLCLGGSTLLAAGCTRDPDAGHTVVVDTVTSSEVPTAAPVPPAPAVEADRAQPIASQEPAAAAPSSEVAPAPAPKSKAGPRKPAKVQAHGRSECGPCGMG